MPYPQDPDILTSYTAFEQSQGDGSFPGQELDVDLVTLRDAISQTNAFVKGVTRSDGKLANQSVGRDQLATDVLLGFSAPTTWTTGVHYKATNTVFNGTGFYLCNVDHTADDFATDEAAGRWTLLADINASGALIVGNNLSDLDSAAAARTNLGLGTVAQDNIVPVSRGGTGLTTLGAVQTAIGVPVGGIIMWSGTIAAIPSGWALCDGLSGTPDLRSRFVVGAGSSYAVGATGGADSVTLTTAQLPAHSHTGTTGSAGNHNHGTGIFRSGSSFQVQTTAGSLHTTGNTDSDGAHTHSFTTNNTGSGNSHENRPPYYALAYIMRVS
jgi:microcystin-dependent protein